MSTTSVRDGMTVISYTVKETAVEMRSALRAAFPGTTFSVRMSRGTGYGWLDVSWTDGPTQQQVQEITDRFRDQRFDGMTDSYVPVEASLYTEPGEEMPVLREYSCSGANGSRSYSPAARDWAANEVRRSWPEVETAGWTVCPATLFGEVHLRYPHNTVEGHAQELLQLAGDLTGHRF